MTIPQWLTFIACTVGLRWLTLKVTPNADAYLLGGLLTMLAIGALYQRWRRPVGSRTSLAAALEQGSTRPVPDQPAQSLFHYPPTSRWRAWAGFFLYGMFGVGFLFPIVSGQEIEPANGWLLFFVGTVFVVLALGQAFVLHWAGDRLEVTNEAVVLHHASGRVTTLPWTTLARASVQRFPAGLVLIDLSGKRLIVYLHLQSYNAFLAEAVRASSAANAS